MAEERDAKAYGDDEVCWEAVLSRDARADGLLLFGVKTTGIYCRPSCPARRPSRNNVVFFDDTASARTAGFRPCKRCSPDHVSEASLLAVRVIKLLQERLPMPSLSELAETLRVSPFHLQRVFKRFTGLTPKRAAAALKAEQFEYSLQRGMSVVDAMYDAGYGSSRALYERVRQELGMTPSAYRRGGDGEQIVFTVSDSGLGRMLVAKTNHGICALWWGEDRALITQLHERFPHARITRDDATFERLVNRVEAYLRSNQHLPDEAIDARGTDFQRRVWDALREIPFGETRTYTEIANAIGQPKAARAVAKACATNPVALYIPCHRIVRSDGELAGYRWGLERKGTLLAKERGGGSS